MSALFRLTVTETKLFFREPMGVFFALAFPPILLVILGSVPSMRHADPALGGLRVIDLYAPIVVVMAIAMFAVNGLPQLLGTYREKGILRRMRTTPVKPGLVLAAQLLMATALSVSTMVVILAIGRLAFQVHLPSQLAGYVIAYVLAALAMFAIGLLVASVASSGKAAGAIGTVLFFPTMFFAGLWVPRASMPDVLRRISDFTPLGAGVQSLQDAAGGHWPQLLHVAVMLGWVVVAGGLAARYFRWE
ncbi:ABC transporter permease [Actinokineospora inagensis]|uniref:ABC transporter permease n=1 Tax=Actinokineospora inagensis TaxID=103730 RepID=UPI000429E35D|nr:ABC transporter permease [Actinokineospora inagensis]